jgi:magnesium-transporting ATPase (P-type)
MDNHHHHNKKEKKRSLESSTYFLLFLYAIILTLAVYYVITEEFSMKLSRMQVVVRTKEHLREVNPALNQARNVMKQKFNSQEIISAYQLFYLIISIFVCTWLFMRYLPRHALNFILEKWSQQYDVAHSNSKRDIKLVHGSELSELEYVTSDKITNYISSTVFDSSSRIKLLILSFIYGGAVYLSQKMQVWCFAIAFVQLLVFHTGKSFWPLIIFALFIAFMHALSELNLWRADHQKNTRPVHKLNSKSKKEGIQEEIVERGKLRPGDIIRIRVGEEIPADILLIDARIEETNRTDGKSEEKTDIGKKNTRLIFYTDEVQVTGENTPVRKYVLARDDLVTSIEIENVKSHKALINSHYLVDVDQNVAYAGSRLVSKIPNLTVSGVVCWVSTETKALSNPVTVSSSRRFKQPSPFDEFTTKGFFISVLAMMVIATLNAIVAYFYNEQDETDRVSFSIVLVNHVMYLNMMVPQAMEQLRLVTAALLCYAFEASNVKCNVPKVIDVFGHATRIVTDKTGTLTENKMIAKVSMVFNQHNEHENAVVISDNHPEIEGDPVQTLDLHALAVYSTTGMEPEEIAIRNRIEKHSSLEFYDPPDIADVESGSICYTINGRIRELVVHVSFGFQRNLISKSVIFQDTETGKYYVGVQAGGDEFWTDVVKQTTDSAAKLDAWDNVATSFPKFRGAPRTWSHGLKELSEQEANELIKEWRSTIRIGDKESRRSTQEKIVLKALQGISLISKTHMVDQYREGAIAGIQKLRKAGKQIVMCTGDSYNAAHMIAKQLGFSDTHFKIDGTSEETLLESLQKAMELGANHSCTFYFDSTCMTTLQNIDDREEGFSGECYELLLALLESKHQKKHHRYLHCAVFCRATPGLKPWVVQLMQHKHTTTVVENFFWKRHYVIAVGDGINDINMMRVADASMGIFSGETKDVCDQASVWHHEWAPLVDLLLKDGPEKATLLGTMVKMVFLKHWLTAFALFADLIYNGFILLPMDPCHPILMMIYNAVIFTQIATHSASDNISNPSDLYKKKMLSVRSLTRWIVGAAVSGFVTDWVARWLVPDAGPNQFGAMIQVGQAASVTVYIFMATNLWSNDKSSTTTTQSTDNQSESSNAIRYRDTVIIACAGLFSIITACFASVYVLRYPGWDTLTKSLSVLSIFTLSGYPGLKLLNLLDRDAHKIKRDVNRLIHLAFTNRNELLNILIKFSHTKNGRFVTTMLFAVAIKFVTGESFAGLLLTGFIVSLVSVVIFLVLISRMGFLRALFNGNVLAVAFFFFMCGMAIGRSTAKSSNCCQQQIIQRYV